MVSVSGSKMYSVNTNYSDIKAKIGGIVQLYQVISIKWKELVYKSYTATGKLYDSFELPLQVSWQKILLLLNSQKYSTIYRL